MTITIIKTGNDPKLKPRECTCQRCGTIFTCERTDCKFHPHDPRTTDQREMIDTYSVGCPHCGETVHFSEFGWRDPI